MNSIGIIGLGYVGSAVMEGLRHAFRVFTYDIKSGRGEYSKASTCYHSNPTDIDGIEFVVSCSDGPIFLCLPTPMNVDGTCNLMIIRKVVNALSQYAHKYKKELLVVIKSTVLPGTTQEFNNNFPNLTFCYNPEFLTERNSLQDFKNQDRIIVGGPHKGTAILKQLYETAYPNVPVTKTSSTIAELVKYTTNCFLAVKVSFANEMQQLCEQLGEDYDKVVEYATKDKRLGSSHWSVPGPDGKKGWGGSCFVKDLNALMKQCKELGLSPNTMEGAWRTNLEVRPERDWEQLKGRAVTDPEQS